MHDVEWRAVESSQLGLLAGHDREVFGNPQAEIPDRAEEAGEELRCCQGVDGSFEGWEAVEQPAPGWIESSDGDEANDV